MHDKMLQTNREMQRVQINKLIKGKQGTGVYNQEKMKIFFFKVPGGDGTKT